MLVQLEECLADWVTSPHVKVFNAALKSAVAAANMATLKRCTQLHSAVEFDSVLEKAHRDRSLVVMDFTATWCVCCMLSAVLPYIRLMFDVTMGVEVLERQESSVCVCVCVREREEARFYIATIVHTTPVAPCSCRCGPCQMMRSVVGGLSEAFPSVVFVAIDVDLVPDVAKRFDVTTLPTFVLWRGGNPPPSDGGSATEVAAAATAAVVVLGEEVKRIQGANPSELREAIASRVA